MNKIITRVFGDRVEFDYRSVAVMATVAIIVGGLALVIGSILGIIFNIIL